ncbi:hypothetical protein DFH27DRAFT_32888 [Peziza echinospora]|nr:hypothetical protein DFH27DRAFT_32888 [Peziza echinospora]
MLDACWNSERISYQQYGTKHIRPTHIGHICEFECHTHRHLAICMSAEIHDGKRPTRFGAGKPLPLPGPRRGIGLIQAQIDHHPHERVSAGALARKQLAAASCLVPCQDPIARGLPLPCSSTPSLAPVTLVRRHWRCSSSPFPPHYLTPATTLGPMHHHHPATTAVKPRPLIRPEAPAALLRKLACGCSHGDTEAVGPRPAIAVEARSLLCARSPPSEFKVGTWNFKITNLNWERSLQACRNRWGTPTWRVASTPGYS